MTDSFRRQGLGSYTIGQLRGEFGATPRALRFHKEQGLLSPGRRESARLYSYKDCARLILSVASERRAARAVFVAGAATT